MGISQSSTAKMQVPLDTFAGTYSQANGTFKLTQDVTVDFLNHSWPDLARLLPIGTVCLSCTLELSNQVLVTFVATVEGNNVVIHKGKYPVSERVYPSKKSKGMIAANLTCHTRVLRLVFKSPGEEQHHTVLRHVLCFSAHSFYRTNNTCEKRQGLINTMRTTLRCQVFAGGPIPPPPNANLQANMNQAQTYGPNLQALPSPLVAPQQIHPQQEWQSLTPGRTQTPHGYHSLRPAPFQPPTVHTPPQSHAQPVWHPSSPPAPVQTQQGFYAHGQILSPSLSFQPTPTIHPVQKQQVLPQQALHGGFPQAQGWSAPPLMSPEPTHQVWSPTPEWPTTPPGYFQQQVLLAHGVQTYQVDLYQKQVEKAEQDEAEKKAQQAEQRANEAERQARQAAEQRANEVEEQAQQTAEQPSLKRPRELTTEQENPPPKRRNSASEVNMENDLDRYWDQLHTPDFFEPNQNPSESEDFSPQQIF